MDFSSNCSAVACDFGGKSDRHGGNPKNRQRDRRGSATNTHRRLNFQLISNTCVERFTVSEVSLAWRRMAFCDQTSGAGRPHRGDQTLPADGDLSSNNKQFAPLDEFCLVFRGDQTAKLLRRVSAIVNDSKHQRLCFASIRTFVNTDILIYLFRAQTHYRCEVTFVWALFVPNIN